MKRGTMNGRDSTLNTTIKEFSTIHDFSTMKENTKFKLNKMRKEIKEKAMYKKYIQKKFSSLYSSICMYF